jgi:HEPN domain-containing protein
MMLSEAQRWIRFAEEDLRVAEIVFREGIYNQVCFHAQQCVEKCVKAVFLAQRRLPPKVHAIARLLSLLEVHPFEGFEEELILLDRFYISTRYPDVLPGSLPEGMPTREDAESALQVARKAYEITCRYLGID